MAAPTQSLSGSRRSLALAFSDGPRTLNEVARRLGKSTSSIYGLAQRMLAEGLLTAEDDPPTRGTHYWLTDDARPLLEIAADQNPPPGMLLEGQRFVFAWGNTARVAVQRLLEDGFLEGVLAWAAEVDGGLLLVVLPETGRNEVQRLATAFDSAGLQSAYGRVGEFIAPKDLRAEARSAIDHAQTVSEISGKR
jgi:DNA-binding MarR family transcriptional regulator